ncbi:MAG: translational GTPase TypA [Alphaproteobacteria bacterium]|nr:translational GTPase TypA [Alphaproteobacteria bacterium]MCZ6494736.1 translational GTPase TypA [Alphaproteobacteria bacterium]
MELRNIAIIAHVDHGKTTLVDCLLRETGTFRAGQKVAEQALDSGDIERERGITILAKCTSVAWRDVRINIVDTPGHADFGGEVERVLSMVDGVLLLVDAAEGPMPQTKFVLGKALALGLQPIVIVNKTDRAAARPFEVQDQTFDLMAALGANERQLDFPTLFASAKEGWAAADPGGARDSMAPLLDLILDHVPPPEVNRHGPFRVLVTTLEYDPYLGRVLTGRINDGSCRINSPLRAIGRDGHTIEDGRVVQLLAFRGLERTPIKEAHAGDIVAIAGLAKASVADTLCDPAVTEPLAAQPVDPPTLAMSFSVNDSPFAGGDGDKVTSRLIGARLAREAEGNVAIRVRETGGGEFEVAGRGELQIAVLIEIMRREGFELSVSRPRVLFRTDPETGKVTEPMEEVVIDVDEEFAGAVIEKLGRRRAELVDHRPTGGAKQRLTFHAPTRSLIGYHSEFLTDTRGTGIMNRVFHGYAPHQGEIEGRHSGVLISNGQGATVPYALWNLEERGRLFVGPGEATYAGMIIGEHSRGNDLDVNPLRTKQLTNIRAAGKDEAVVLTQPVRFSLEQAIAYIDDDELVEVTPKTFRLRKRLLGINDRKRAARAKAAG